MKKISTCLIVRDEESNIGDLLTDLSKFSDEIIVVDTGSIDNTIEVCKKFDKVKLFNFTWIYDFSAARNYSFSKATCDYIFWCDSDDRIPHNLCMYLQSIKSDGIPDGKSSLIINYLYSKADGGYYVPRERLLLRSSNPTWVGKIHEFIRYSISDFYIVPNECGYIIHNHTKPHTSRNLDIYQRMIDSNEEMTTRDKLYYANELYDHKRYHESFKIYFDLMDNGTLWEIDELNCCMKIHNKSSKVDLKLENYISRFFNLFKKGVTRPDLLCIIGDWYCSINLIKIAKKFYELALDNKPTGLNEFLYLSSYHTVYPYLQLCMINWNLGDKDSAVWCNNMAMKFDCTHPSIISNFAFFKDLKLDPDNSLSANLYNLEKKKVNVSCG